MKLYEATNNNKNKLFLSNKNSVVFVDDNCYINFYFLTKSIPAWNAILLSSLT
jgi:hypothetical protein